MPGTNKSHFNKISDFARLDQRGQQGPEVMHGEILISIGWTKMAIMDLKVMHDEILISIGWKKVAIQLQQLMFLSNKM